MPSRSTRWVVVGRGMAGAVVARRLAEAGCEVLVVEGGRAVSTPPGSHVRNAPPYRDDPDAWFGAIDGLFDYLDRAAAPARLPGAFTTAIDGGMGVAWTNNCPRAVAGVDRPPLLGDAEWERCYGVAERYLGVRPDEFPDSARARYVAGRLADRLADAGRRLVPLPLAGRRRAPTRIAYVGPADVLAPAAGAAVRRGEVERIATAGGRVRGVVVHGGLLRADHVVVAAGAVGTPGLLWRSGIDPPALGRNLSFHPVLIGQVVLDRPVGRARPADPLPRLGIPPTSAAPWFTMILRDTNPLPPTGRDIDVAPDRLVEIQAFAPVDPHPDNRLSIGERGRLTFDVPLRPADEARRAAIAADADALCERIGRWREGCEPRWAPLGTPHLMGSCRMGVDPAGSVVDPEGRVHGVAGLAIAGNGVVPGRLAVNPTLTAAALAVRTADAVAASA